MVCALLAAALSLPGLAQAGGPSGDHTFTPDPALSDAPDALTADGRCDTDLEASGDQCTLRAAVQQANVVIGGTQTIVLAPGTYSLTLAGSGEDTSASGDLDFAPSSGSRIVVVPGEGATARNTTIDATELGDRAIDVQPSADVQMGSVRISGGSPPSGEDGGVVRNRGTLALDHVQVTGGDASPSEGGGEGGGIANEDGASLTLTNVTVSGNDAASGGGIANRGSLTASNLTVSGNSAGDRGGGLYDVASTQLSLLSTTIFDNTASFSETGNSGGGIYRDSTSNTLRYTVVAQNRVGDAISNCGGEGPLGDDGTNLEDDTDDPNQCGFAQAVDGAGLGSFGDNGGQVDTVPLLQDSPAIDVDTGSGGCTSADARDVARLGPCDAGSYEYDGPRHLSIDPPSHGTITSSPEGIDCGTGGDVCDADFPNDAEVVLTATADDGFEFVQWTDDCAETTAATCDLTMTQDHLVGAVFAAAGSSVFDVTTTADAPDEDTADGLCQSSLSDGACTLRAAVMQASHDAQVDGRSATIRLTVSGTYALTPPGESGDATGDLDFVVPDGTITVEGDGSARDFVISAAGLDDRAIDVSAGAADVVLRNLTVVGGTAGSDGGAIRNFGELTLDHVQVQGGVAGDGTGGGIYNAFQGTLRLTHVTVSGSQGGGGIANDGEVAGPGDGPAEDVTVVGNADDGVDANGGTFRATGLTIADNETFGLYNGGGEIDVSLALLARNGNNNCEDVVTSAEGNVSDDATCDFQQVPDGAGLAAELQDNGGQVDTLALQPDSPALDVGGSSCPPPADDARDLARGGDNGACDAGAFELQRFAVQVSLDATPHGRVTSSPAGIDCPGTCSELVTEGQALTLTATPDDGYRIAGWTGDCAGAGSATTCELAALDGARSLGVTFEAIESSSGGGGEEETPAPEPTPTPSGGGGGGAVPLLNIASGVDLVVTQVADPSIVLPGAATAFRVTVRNAGADAASNVTLTETLATGLAFASATSSQGSCSGTGPVVCSLGSLAAGASASVVVSATPTVPGPVAGAASATATEADANPADNSASAGVSVQLPQIAPPTVVPPAPRTLPPPVQGRLVNAVPLTGFVFVDGQPFLFPEQLEIGSVVDVRGGSIQLVIPGGGSAVFTDGIFRLVQAATPGAPLELVLQGGVSRAVCGTNPPQRARRPAMALRPKILNVLRANGKGRFRTRARYSSATVRGTAWTIAERCDGTFNYVRTGSVELRDFSRRRTLILRARHSYLAKPPR